MTDLRNFVITRPSILTIAPTYKCTASCKECCFRCTPKVETILETEAILQYIKESAESFPSLKLLVLTGGECFVVSKDIPKMIICAKEHGMISRVVTNGFWAKSYETAIRRLTPLINAGLKEINFSTGDNHQKYVPFHNIINGIKAAYDLGIRSIAVSVESFPNAIFTSESILNHPFLSSLIDDGILFLINASWMKFSTDNDDYWSAKTTFLECFETHKPCKYIYDNIVINPYSQLLACCGLTVEYNKYLKLGDLNKGKSISSLYYNQFSDLFKFWLHVDGPAIIYDKVADIRKIKKKTFPHECQYCLELVLDKNNLSVVKAMLETEFPSIFFRYSIRNKSLYFNNKTIKP